MDTFLVLSSIITQLLCRRHVPFRITSIGCPRRSSLKFTPTHLSPFLRQLISELWSSVHCSSERHPSIPIVYCITLWHHHHRCPTSFSCTSIKNSFAFDSSSTFLHWPVGWLGKSGPCLQTGHPSSWLSNLDRWWEFVDPYPLIVSSIHVTWIERKLWTRFVTLAGSLLVLLIFEGITILIYPTNDAVTDTKIIISRCNKRDVVPIQSPERTFATIRQWPAETDIIFRWEYADQEAGMRTVALSFVLCRPIVDLWHISSCSLILLSVNSVIHWPESGPPPLWNPFTASVDIKTFLCFLRHKDQQTNRKFTYPRTANNNSSTMVNHALRIEYLAHTDGRQKGYDPPCCNRESGPTWKAIPDHFSAPSYLLLRLLAWCGSAASYRAEWVCLQKDMRRGRKKCLFSFLVGYVPINGLFCLIAFLDHILHGMPHPNELYHPKLA